VAGAMTAEATETATVATWSGWWRKGRGDRWRRVVAGCPSPRAAWDALLGRDPPLPSGDLQVVTGDSYKPAGREQEGASADVPPMADRPGHARSTAT
jgi:hypothetical protein